MGGGGRVKRCIIGSNSLKTRIIYIFYLLLNREVLENLVIRICFDSFIQ